MVKPCTRVYDSEGIEIQGMGSECLRDGGGSVGSVTFSSANASRLVADPKVVLRTG